MAVAMVSQVHARGGHGRARGCGADGGGVPIILRFDLGPALTMCGADLVGSVGG